MHVIVFIIGLGFGFFAFSQIVYPLGFALPRIKKLQREKKLKKPVPVHTILLAPIIWGILLAASVLLVLKYFSDYQYTYLVSLGIILIFVIAQIPKKNKNLEIDFVQTWKDYLEDV